MVQPELLQADITITFKGKLNAGSLGPDLYYIIEGRYHCFVRMFLLTSPSTLLTCLHSLLKPAIGVGLCSLAMPLRRFGMRLPSIPHLLLSSTQSWLRGTATMLVNSMGYDMYPATRTAAMVCGSLIRKMRHYGEPHPFALNGEQVNDPLRGVSQSPVL